MKTLLKRLLATFALIALGASPLAQAEDIDIFGGSGGSGVPTLLIILDNTSSNDAAYSSQCPFAASPATTAKPLAPPVKLLDMVYCSLYGAIDAIKGNTNLESKLKIALMSGGSGSNKGGQFYIPASSPYDPILMDLGGIAQFENAIVAGIPKATGNAKLDGDMTEAWAWMTGNTGPRSGISYTRHAGTLACQKNTILMIGATSKQGRPCNGSGCWSDNDLSTASWTDAQKVAISSSTVGPYTDLDSGSYVDEWARYFHGTNFSGDPDDIQTATFYAITAGSDPKNIAASGTPDYTQELVSAANQGGGEALSGIDYETMKNSFLEVFNQVAAINSVFASSSLPISSNTQGTFQNQVYIGMFRPDGDDGPRWMGNLKQYQFGVGGTASSPTLFLADSAGTAVINGTTGFITPTAVSFWTKKDTSALPDSIAATGGFWVNDQQGSGKGFDSPDGEVVEKGGVGQQIRLANLQDDYATNADSPRNIYTCTGICAAGSALSATPFATNNSSLTQGAFGIAGPTSTVSSVSRSGTTVTMVLSSAPSPVLTNGQAVTINGATDTELNGTFTITLVNATTFTFPIKESPPTPSTGTYTVSIPASPTPVSSLVRSWDGSKWIATSTTAAAHGFTTGQKITILGASEAEYNGQQTITVTSPTTFTYPITPGPGTSGGAGNATDGSGANPITIGSVAMGTIATSAPFGETVTAVTGVKTLPTSYTVGSNVIVTDVVPGGYNGTFAITAISSQGNGANKRATISYVIGTSPTSPATGTISADPSVSVAVSSITHTTSCFGGSPSPLDTVTVNTATTNPFTTGQTISISGAPKSNESAYLGSFLIGTTPTTTSFTLAVPITASPPCSPSPAGISVSTGPTSVNLASFINWVRGEDNVGDEPSPDPGTITVRPSVHGDVVHARPTVVNYGGSIGVVVFYGSNDGTFRAVNGNQTGDIPDTVTSTNVKPGQEIWSYVAPEFFYDSSKGYSPLVRLYQNSPVVALATTPSGLTPTPKPKDYFMDGSAGVYQTSGNSKVYLYLSARRGGRFITALDVTDPTNPKFLWKKSNADFSEFGYTWSTPKAARLRGYVDGSGNPIPVVIFGGGYDPNEDNEPPTADTMGRGIYILDGIDGHLVWSATFGAGATGTCTGTCTLSDMTYSIPADVTLVNRDFDQVGYIDRLYAADLGGNIWRVDLESAGFTAPVANIGPSTWTITHFASLGGASADATKRKFFYPPDVVATKLFDMVLAGTGDREHPLYSANTTQSYSIVNRFYGLKDPNTGASVPSGATTITDDSVDTTNSIVTNLTDATTTPYSLATANNGFYITFLNAGEKAVNAPTTVGGFTYIGTNTPPTPTSLACNNLGTARGYQINFLTGANASVVFTNGGLPPSPVAGLVNVPVDGVDRLVPFCLGCGNPAGGSPDASSSIGGGKPPIPVPPVRKRVYWYLQNHDG